MHSKGMKLISGMTRTHFRRWVVYIIEKTLKYSVAMIIISIGCVVTALIIAWCLNKLGVAYG